MRKRIIKPDFWIDENLPTISHAARLLYIGLWGIADDNYGTLPDRPKWIKSQIFPHEDIDVKPLLAEIAGIGDIVRFMGQDGHPYWYVKSFKEHQVINNPSKPKYPPYDAAQEVKHTPGETKTEHAEKPRKGRGKHPITKEAAACRAYYYEQYEHVRGHKYHAAFAKDGVMLDNICRNIPISWVKGMIDFFLRWDDEFIKSGGYSLSMFNTKLNAIMELGIHKSEWVKRHEQGGMASVKEAVKKVVEAQGLN